MFDAALAELAVVARGSPCLLVGDFNVEPTKILCLSKGISAGLLVDVDAAWSDARGSVVGSPLAVVVGITWFVAHLPLLLHFLVLFMPVIGCSPTLLSVRLLFAVGGLAG